PYRCERAGHVNAALAVRETVEGAANSPALTKRQPPDTPYGVPGGSFAANRWILKKDLTWRSS
ncbi:hypothetical protein, partial [Escherichia coli]|uniref:hypothetical protein n=1 Tax=Escherichia coli TaxID=562 RepID=UPI001A7E1BAF